MTYAILGASGQVGGAALTALAAQLGQADGISDNRAAPILALSRRRPASLADQTEWRAVDALDTAALTEALRPAATAFVLNPVPADAQDVFDVANRWSTSVARALTEAGVSRVVALSSQAAHLAEGTGVIVALHRFEQALRRTGIPTTFVRPAYFMESWLPAVVPALQTGTLPAFRLPVGQAFDTISAGDVGRLVASLLLDPTAQGIVNAVGPRQYSELDTAAILAGLTGGRIGVEAVPAEAREAALRDAGLGESYAAALAAMYDALDGDVASFEPAARTWQGTTTLDVVLAAAVAAAGTEVKGAV